MIFTSYFASNLYNPQNSVAICVGANFWKGERYEDLQPTQQILDWWKKLSPQEQQEKRGIFVRLYYRDVLSKLDPKKVAKDLDGKTLLCFEKIPDMCHRHVVRVWLNMNGFKCEELI